ncbi:hypothetical protein E2C01_016360 [Portunus trituberculatus]|uniref:Uncharacterized protein n=1 Tax=Portunus trituberculatus TaxID=210409 RepID=A0A5B7DQU9_PORTR|nr:hypothetical protein [Portunus trituberculatus]
MKNESYSSSSSSSRRGNKTPRERLLRGKGVEGGRGDGGKLEVAGEGEGEGGKGWDRYGLRDFIYT